MIGVSEGVPVFGDAGTVWAALGLMSAMLAATTQSGVWRWNGMDLGMVVIASVVWVWDLSTANRAASDAYGFQGRLRAWEVWRCLGFWGTS